jgi:hypothetical protein
MPFQSLSYLTSVTPLNVLRSSESSLVFMFFFLLKQPLLL